jgi:hypothetical protein
VIGVVSGVAQPVVVRNTLRNVPEKGIYNWDPGAFFGMYRPTPSDQRAAQVSARVIRRFRAHMRPTPSGGC